MALADPERLYTQDDLDDILEAQPLYDPRRRRHHRRVSYHRRRRSRARYMYDPRRRIGRRLRRYGGRLRRYRPGRRTSSLIGKLTNRKASAGWGALSFLWSINQGAMLQGYTLAQRLQGFFLGVPLYRLSGNASLLPSGWLPNVSRSGFSTAKALNTLTIAGIMASIYGYLPFKFLPMRGLAKRLGPPVAIGSFIGGGFDPDAPGTVVASTPIMSSVSTPIASIGYSDTVRR